MAVSWVGSTESVRTDTSDPATFSHTVGSTAKGLLLFALHGTSSTDHAPLGNAVTVGGKAMGKVATATSTTASGEPGRVDAWFLGHDLPAAGAQTVSIDLASGTTDDIQFVMCELSGSTDLELLAIVASSQAANSANPSSGSIAYGGRTGIAVGALYSGLPNVGDPAINANMSAVQDHDYGAFVSRVDRQTTPGSSDFTFSYTASSDDWCMLVVVVTEEVTSAVRSAILALSPTGYWRLNEPVGCLTAFDRSPNLRHGAYNGTVTLGAAGGIPTETDTAITTDGSTGYVSVPDDSAFSLTATNQLSMHCTLKESAGASGTVVGKGTGSNYEYAFDWDSSTIVANLYDSAGNSRAQGIGGGASQRFGTYSVTLDDATDTMLAYYNGTQTASDTTWSGTSTNGTSALNIGRRPDNVQFWAGRLQDVAMFSDVLTPTEEASLCATIFGVTATDALARSESMARTGTFLRAVSDAQSQSDAGTRLGGFLRAPADALSQSDSAARLLALPRTTIDAQQQSDAATRVLSAPRTTTDALQLADAATRTGTFARAVSDALAMADAATRASAVARSIADAVAWADVATRALVLGRTVVDDAVLGGVEEFVTLGDAATRLVVLGRAVSDALATAESAQRSLSSVRTATDALSRSDSAARSIAFARAVADTLFPTDAATRSGGFLRAPTDALALADTVTRSAILGRAIDDGLTASESLDRAIVLARIAADALGMADVATRALDLLRTGAELIQVAELVDAVKQGATQLQRTASESLTSADAVARALIGSRLAEDAMAALDDATRLMAMGRVVGDVLFQSDAALIALLSGGNVAPRWGRITLAATPRAGIALRSRLLGRIDLTEDPS